MSKFIVLLKTSYKQKLLSKTIVLTTLLYVVAMALFLFWTDLKSLFVGDNKEQEVVYVVDITKRELFRHFQEGEFIYQSSSIDRAKEAVQKERALASIVLQEEKGALAVTLLSNEPLSLNVQQSLTEQVQTVATFYAYEQLQLTAEQQTLLNTSPHIAMETLVQTANTKSTEEKLAGMLGSYAAGIVIYLLVVSYLSIITTDVASEKGSRALEMLLVSVKPETHFKAKVMAIFCVAMTQFAVIVMAAVSMLALKQNEEIIKEAQSYVSELSFSYIVFVLAFLLLTILLFLIVGALFGSLVSKVEESSQVMTPAMILVIVSFYIMVSAFSNPDSLFVKVFSYVPFTSGMVMPMRMGGSDLSLVEPVVSLGVLIVAVVGCYLVSIRFYKRSVLTYSSGSILQKIKQVLKVTT